MPFGKLNQPSEVHEAKFKENTSSNKGQFKGIKILKFRVQFRHTLLLPFSKFLIIPENIYNFGNNHLPRKNINLKLTKIVTSMRIHFTIIERLLI